MENEEKEKYTKDKRNKDEGSVIENNVQNYRTLQEH